MGWVIFLAPQNIEMAKINIKPIIMMTARKMKSCLIFVVTLSAMLSNYFWRVPRCMISMNFSCFVPVCSNSRLNLDDTRGILKSSKT